MVPEDRDRRGRARRTAGRALCVAAIAAGCAEPDTFSGDPFPIDFVPRAGAVTLAVRASDGVTRPAVVDVMSPLSVLDDGVDTTPARSADALDVIGTDAAGTTVPRARLFGTVLHIHPCDGDPICRVGDPASPFPVAAVVGTDLLGGDAVRFDFAARQLYVLPDIAGDAATRTRLCDGVFPAPFQGAGTLVLEGAEVAFTSRRTVVEGCLGPDVAAATPPAKRGGDVLLVMSTGVGATVIGESAYRRYAEATTAAVPDLLTLPTTTIRLISGEISGRVAVIPELALAATAPKNPRGACRETYASAYLETASALDVCPTGVDCPCKAGDRACSAPAIVHLSGRGGVSVVVVADGEPVLQALRAELRPLVGEIDGVIGSELLADVELDLDYPHDRLLWRCTSAVGCAVRPEVDGFLHQPDLVGCLAAAAARGRPR